MYSVHPRREGSRRLWRSGPMGRNGSGRSAAKPERQCRECIGRVCIGRKCIGRECIGRECIGRECIGRKCIGRECIGRKCIGS